jgi:hypothetical protein
VRQWDQLSAHRLVYLLAQQKVLPLAHPQVLLSVNQWERQ